MRSSEKFGAEIMMYLISRLNGTFYSLAVFCLLAMALLMAIAPAPYLHDFGEWLFQGQIIALKLTDPQAVSGYSLATYPVPNSLAPVLLALLCLMFEPTLAGKIFIVLMLIGWFLTLRVFVQRYVPDHSRGAVILVLTANVVLASFFWYGFVSYQLGLLLLFLFFSSYGERDSLVRMIVYGILFFLSHAMIFLVWCLLLGIMFISSQAEVRWRIFFALLIIAPFPLWFILGRWLTGFVAPVADARLDGIREYLMLKFASPAQHGGFRNMIQPDGSSILEQHGWIYGVGACCTLLVVLLLAIFVLRVFFDKISKQTESTLDQGANHDAGLNHSKIKRQSGYAEPAIHPMNSTAVLRNYGLVLMVLYWIAPFNFFGLIDPGGRLLLPLLAVALMLADADSFIWLRRAAIPAAVGLTISIFLYATLIDYAANNEGYAFQGPPPAIAAPPNHSVVAFNDWTYRNTRYRYFNFRIFAFADRFRQLRTGDLHGLGFRTGPITEFQP